MILPVPLQVLGQFVDAPRKNRNLDLGRTGIFLGSAEVGNELLFSVFGGDHTSYQGITATASSFR